MKSLGGFPFPTRGPLGDPRRIREDGCGFFGRTILFLVPSTKRSGFSSIYIRRYGLGITPNLPITRVFLSTSSLGPWRPPRICGLEVGLGNGGLRHRAEVRQRLLGRVQSFHLYFWRHSNVNSFGDNIRRCWSQVPRPIMEHPIRIFDLNLFLGNLKILHQFLFYTGTVEDTNNTRQPRAFCTFPNDGFLPTIK